MGDLEEGTGTETGAGEDDDGELPPEWGEPVDCEFHRPTGPSTLAISGWLGNEEVTIACEFGAEDDLLNWCPDGSLGLHVECIADGAWDVTLSVVPPQEGTWEDPHGNPRYSLDIKRDGLTWSGGLQNATEHVLSIETIDEDERHIAGSFTGAWYPLTVQNLEFPMGSITGNFELAF